MKSPRIPAHVLLRLVGMFVRRCAWHRQYHGHVKILGVSSWQGRWVTFSDGICADCAARARAERRLPAASPRPARRLLRPDFAFASVVLLAAVGVTLGGLLGPPQPQTVSQSIAPVPGVVASREPGDRVSKSTGSASSRAPARAESGTPPRATASASPQMTGTPAEPDRMVFARPAPPLRVTRGSAKRTGFASYRPMPVAVPVEIASAPDASIETPKRAPLPWAVSFPNVEVQAP